MDVLEAIHSRRSVRSYKPDAVSDETLQTVLDAARWAPSWANTQCARFVVVREQSIKDQLAGCLNPGNPATAAVRDAPVVIAACAVLGKAGYKRGEACTEKGDWFMFDTALAMQNLTLAAHALGLGTVHVGLVDGKKAAEILHLPPDIVFVEMAPLGYPKGESNAPPRKDLAEIVFYERYGPA